MLYSLCFCCTTKWISYMYTYIHSVLNPPSHPFHPAPSQSIWRSSLCYIAASHKLCFRHDSVYMSILLSSASHSPLSPTSTCPVSVSVSIPDLQMVLSEPSFYFYFFKLKKNFTLQYCIGFAIYWLESATGMNHLFRFHAYLLIYGIWFSLSDLLHSVWQIVGPFYIL